MNLYLQVQLLQHLRRDRGDRGFTMIELMMVIVIIGILTAISLPSFLNQANKARAGEAKTYIGTMNRAQKAYYVENGEFATSIGQMEIGIPDTANYDYEIVAQAAWVTNKAIPNDPMLKAYAGVTGIVSANVAEILCQSEVYGLNAVGEGQLVGNELVCPTGFVEVD